MSVNCKYGTVIHGLMIAFPGKQLINMTGTCNSLENQPLVSNQSFTTYNIYHNKMCFVGQISDIEID